LGGLDAAWLIVFCSGFKGFDAVVAPQANLGLRDIFVEMVVVDAPIFKRRDGADDE
jgi:hypothetical protein